MNAYGLAGILKRFYNDFNMNTFDNRLKLQKIIYLLQHFVTDIGFSFTLYLYGPYSSELTKTAFYIEDFKKTRKVRFDDNDIEKKFCNFLTNIKPYQDDVSWLEIASTIILIKNLYSTEDVIKKVNKLKPHFSINKIKEVGLNMKKW